MGKQLDLFPDKKFKKMVPILKEIGLSDQSAERIARLLLAKPTPEEKMRWQQVGIMYEDKILVTNEELSDLAITVVLWDLVWDKMLVRITDPIEIAAQKEFEAECDRKNKTRPPINPHSG